MDLATEPADSSEKEADPPVYMVELGQADEDDDDHDTTPLGNTEWIATDDVKGGPLDPDGVRAARALEMKFVKDREIYEYHQLQPGDPRPAGLKWIDTNKGDDLRAKLRSRIVSMEFRRSKAEAIFAGTPPLEAFRALLAII